MYLQTIEQTTSKYKIDWMEHILKFVSDILGYIFAFLGGSVGLKILDMWLKKKQNNTTDLYFNVSNLAEIHRTMEATIRETHAERFLILKGSNGGGIPKPGSPFYVSVIHGVDTISHVSEHIGKYQRLLTDRHYLEMLSEILLKGFVYYSVSEMEDCMLKRIYVKEGVTGSYVFSIAKTKTEFIFGSISTHSGQNLLKDDQLEIDLAVNRIRQVFGKYSKGVIL